MINNTGHKNTLQECFILLLKSFYPVSGSGNRIIIIIQVDVQLLPTSERIRESSKVRSPLSQTYIQAFVLSGMLTRK